MSQRDVVLRKIRNAFSRVEYPGDDFLQGSEEGCEPFEEISAFIGKTDWNSLEPTFLDAHYVALSFFSTAAFRFYLPAYLISDLHNSLRTADPVFHLTYGLSKFASEIARKERWSAFGPWSDGEVALLNQVRDRLSSFTVEEAQAIVAYLEFRRDTYPNGPDHDCIDLALAVFWRGKAEKASS